MIEAALKQSGIFQQYLFWWLGREPSQKDFDKLNACLRRNRAILIRGDKNSVDYRIFDKFVGSIHIIVRRKYFGFAINIHRDVEIHTKINYDRWTLRLASKIYSFLARIRYGRAFLLPRQDKEFNHFLKYSRNKWNLI